MSYVSSIYVICLNAKTLIRHLAILCGIHVRHRFNRFCIYTTWGEFPSEWGELSSECGASCLGRVFFWASCLWGELSCFLAYMQSKKRDLLVHCSCSYIYMQEFCSSKCHIFRPFHKHMNTFVWLLFSVPENKYGYVRLRGILTDIEMNEGPAIKQQPSK